MMSATRPTTVALALAATLLLAGCGGVAGGRGAAQGPTATPGGTAGPKPTLSRNVDNVVTADGQLVLPLPPQVLSFATGGELLSLNVVEGETVQAGEVLATVDPGPANLSLAQAEASLTQARATVDKLARGATIEAARIDVERAKNNLWGQQAQRDAVCGAAEHKMAQQVDCDGAQANVQAMEQSVAAAQKSLESAQANQPGELASAQAQLNQARLALDQARLDRGRTELKAPFDGVVSQVNVIEGVRVAPGSPVLTLVKTRPLRFATSNLGERNVGDIEPGAPATVTLTSFPDQSIKGTVQRVAPQAATDESGLTSFVVEIDLQPTDLPIRAGMTGRAEIQVGAP
jgi:multidrug resistance efflux pump